MGAVEQPLLQIGEMFHGLGKQDRTETDRSYDLKDDGALPIVAP
jgi:hypothetical protein